MKYRDNHKITNQTQPWDTQHKRTPYITVTYEANPSTTTNPPTLSATQWDTQAAACQVKTDYPQYQEIKGYLTPNGITTSKCHQ